MLISYYSCNITIIIHIGYDSTIMYVVIWLMTLNTSRLLSLFNASQPLYYYLIMKSSHNYFSHNIERLGDYARTNFYPF